MTRRHAKRSDKAGLPPGTLVHVGPPTAAPVRMHLMDYDAERLEEQQVTGPEAVDRCATVASCGWTSSAYMPPCCWKSWAMPSPCTPC